MCAAVKPNWNQAVEILDLRHFSSADLRSVLEEESVVWGRELFWDYSQSAEMILRYVDARILPGYVAVERGRVAGYAFFVYEASKGVIGDLYVRNGVSATGAGEYGLETRLLTHVIETLKRSPGIHRIEAQLLLHNSGTVADPFLNEGFRQHRRLFMVLPLQNGGGLGEVEMRPAPPAFQLRRWTEHDYQQAASLITACYRGHVDSDINDQYRTASGSLRFLNNIVRFPGCGVFDPLSSYVAVHKDSRSLAGLILCSRVKANVGHITQICVLPEFRGLGIGGALLSANLAELRHRNFASLSLTVTEANQGAVELYRRLGYHQKRVFDAFVWEG
jgi:ribosomal protein S18 acetylase RimI-like enzyme